MSIVDLEVYAKLGNILSNNDYAFSASKWESNNTFESLLGIVPPVFMYTRRCVICLLFLNIVTLEMVCVRIRAYVRAG